MDEIYIGSDHGGFELKDRLRGFLKGKGYNVVDVGPYEYDKDDDYPDYAEKVCKKVLETKGRGIIICKHAHGITIAANKMRGIYASPCWNETSARMARVDNDTNVLCLSGVLTKPEEAEKIADVWLSTPFSAEERHVRRIGKVRDIERRNFG